MLSERTPDPRDEEGTSMVELVVGMGMGMVVLAGLSLLLIVVLHGNARVDARVEASDNARLTMTRIIEELHSACVTPTTAPIQAGSTGERLIFLRGTYGQAATVTERPTETEIFYTKAQGTLSESDRVETSNGVFGPASTRILASGVSPPDGSPIFEYKNGTVQVSRFETPLSTVNAGYTILVGVAFIAAPRSEPVADPGAATPIQNSATLRLTPPSYSESAKAMPCQ
jgi:hypothetical protein